MTMIMPNWEKIPLSEIANFYGGYSYKGEELVDDGNVASIFDVLISGFSKLRRKKIQIH